MTCLCEYGCGQVAIYYKLPSDKVPNGRYMCSTSPNSCPSKRAKLSGDKNPSRRPEIIEKISKINSVLFASGSEYRNKCIATLKERYGVDNSMKLPDVAQKVVAARRKKNNYCVTPTWLLTESAVQKRQSTRIAKGLTLDPALRAPFDRYESTVDYYTIKTYTKFKNEINPLNLTRGRTKGSHQLDHIVSKVDGFTWGLDPMLLTHPANLRMLTISENISKGATSHYTKEQLLEAIAVWEDRNK